MAEVITYSYWLFFGLVSLVGLIAIFVFISMVKDQDSDAHVPFFVGAVCLLILWGVSEWADYGVGKSKEITPTNLSIMHDDDVCIVRYGDDYQKTFSEKSDYDDLLDSSFVLLKTPTYDLWGEHNGYEYEIDFKND